MCQSRTARSANSDKQMSDIMQGGMLVLSSDLGKGTSHLDIPVPSPQHMLMLVR